jgi:hypothetical protein
MVALVVSVGLTGLGLAVSFLPEDGLMGSLAVLVVGTVYAGIFALGAGPVGVLLVHVTCRHVEAQWVHVLAAGMAGVLTGIAFGQLVDVGSSALDGWVLTLILGISTAIGRAAVIPLARGRRTPVDDDFAGRPPGW